MGVPMNGYAILGSYILGLASGVVIYWWVARQSRQGVGMVAPPGSLPQPRPEEPERPSLGQAIIDKYFAPKVIEREEREKKKREAWGATL